MLSNLRKLEEQMVQTTGTAKDLESYRAETYEQSLQQNVAIKKKEVQRV